MINIPKKYSRKLKWGVAGCGRFAEQTFLPTIKLLRKSVVTSLYSSDIKRAKSLADKFGIEKHFNNYDEFLKSDIGAVYISSANVNHYQQVIKAAKAGKHILCEKPLAMNLSEVEDFSCAIVKFENGGYGFFNVSFNNKKAFNRIEILGHKGAISLDNLIGGRLHTAKLTILLDGEAKKAFRKRGNRQFNLLKSVQNSFLNNQTPLVTGYDGLINMKLMEELESKCH